MDPKGDESEVDLMLRKVLRGPQARVLLLSAAAILLVWLAISLLSYCSDANLQHKF